MTTHELWRLFSAVNNLMFMFSEVVLVVLKNTAANITISAERRKITLDITSYDS